MRETVALSTAWFDLLARYEESSPEPFYCIRTTDYVTVVAVTENHKILLVRQFRPAVQSKTLELPAGHVDEGEAPEQAAIRELAEETGYRVGRIELIGVLNPDTGRMANQMWCYFADACSPGAARNPEPGIETVEVSPAELSRMVRLLEFDHALHLAALFLSVSQGRLELPFTEITH